MPAGKNLDRSDGIRQPVGTIIAFLLPALTIYVAFTAYPAIRTFWNSFHIVLPRREEFIGLANYIELAKDDIFWKAVRNTITWACMSPLVEVSVGLISSVGALCQGTRQPLLPCRLVHAGADVLHRDRHPVAVDL